MQLLLVEDDKPLAASLRQALQKSGYAVNHVDRGESALTAIRTERPDIVVLDIGLPDVDGISVLKQLRQSDTELPVLLLTARDSVEDKVAGLDSGADDYLAKPFEMTELLARLRVLERRLASIKTSEISVGGIVLDTLKQSVMLADEPLELARREYMLQTALADVKNDYDYVIIDCAPSLGLVTLNALTAADSVIIPIQCEYFALEGLGKLLNTVRSVQNLQNPELQIEGMLLTMYDSRLRLSNQVVDEVRQHFQQLVFDTVISRNVRLSEAPSFGEPIMVYDAASTGAENYLNLARELLARNAQVGA